MTSSPATANPEAATPGERISRFFAQVEAMSPTDRLPSDLETRDALVSIAMLCRNAVLTVVAERSCVLSVRVLSLVLGHYSVPGIRPTAVTALALNKAAIPYAEASRPVSEWPDDAYSVGVVGPDTNNGRAWDGHLVLTVRTSGRRLLIDPSAGQFSRPERALNVPDVICWPLPELWTPQDAALVPLDDAMIVYHQSLAKGWKSAADWNPERPRTLAIVDAAVEAIDTVRAREPQR